MWKVSSFVATLLLFNPVLGSIFNKEVRGLAGECPASDLETCLCSFDAGDLSHKRCTFKEDTTWNMGTSSVEDDITGRLFYTIDYDGSGSATSSYCVKVDSGAPFEQYCLNLSGCTASTVERELCTCEIKVDDKKCTSCAFCVDTNGFTYDCDNVVDDLKTEECVPLEDYADLVPELGGSGARALFVSIPVVASVMAVLLSLTV